MVKKVDSDCSLFIGKKFRRALACIVAFSLAAFAFSACYASVPEDKLSKPDSRPDEAGIREKLGIKPVAIRLTAAGGMIDFRYSVVDPQKSLPLFDRKIKTYLVNQANGDKFAVPTDTKLGPLRSSSREPEAGREYFIFFVNPGKLLKRGNKVTVVVGDIKIENLTLE
jgi:hypothetical protein